MEVRVYGGDMLTLLNNTNDSLWAPPSPSFHETMVNFDQDPQQVSRPNAKRDRNGQSIRASDVEDTGGEEYEVVPYLQGEKKRRLSAEQVQFLEKSFEVDNKLEPERKVQLAKELGLQPRQVAIWFQNRRARYKTKQLEKDYDALKASYDLLKVDYDSLSKEKDNLMNEINLLTKKLKQRDVASDAPHNDVFPSDKEPPKMENVKTEKLMEVPSTKQLVEDANSAKSDVFDSESPHCTDGNNSSLVEDPTEQQSEFLKDEAYKFMSKGVLLAPTPVVPPLPAFNNFLGVEDDACYDDPSASSCNFSLVDDQPFLSWLY